MCAGTFGPQLECLASPEASAPVVKLVSLSEGVEMGEGASCFHMDRGMWFQV